MTASRTVVPTRCNIGPAEIARRRWVAASTTLATIAIAAVLVATHAPTALRWLVWPLAAGVGVSWLQVFRRFCVRFGALGLENFGRMGEERPVDRAVRAADARRAAEMIIEGVLFGLIVTIAFLQIPG